MIINKKCNNYFHKILIILLLLIIIFICTKKLSKNFQFSKNQNNELPIIHNYKLYNSSEYPFLTLILDFSNFDLILLNDTFLNFINDLSKRLFKDSEIFILYKSTNDSSYNISIKTISKIRRIETFSFNIEDWKKQFYDLLNLVKGKFLILINKIIKIDKNEFNKIFNIIKGNIENIYNFKFGNETFNIVRTKILREIMDEGKEFHNLTDLYNSIHKLPSHNINYIPVAFCPNNYYTYLTYTSMISILLSKGYYTYILFYLIIPFDFCKENIQFIESLYEQFEYFNITFIKMDNRYEKAFIDRYITKSAYFRFSLGELLPNLNKIIYLDSDTICLKDLSNLYNLNFKGKIFIARVIRFAKGELNFEINSGVIFLNLVGMRRMKIEKKVLTLLNKGFKDSFHDQAIINNFFKKYIGFLPPEYNSITFNIKKVKDRKNKIGNLYDFDSLYFAFKFPYIIHYPGDSKTKTYDKEDWYYFARKSKYFHKRTHNYSNIFKYTSYLI